MKPLNLPAIAFRGDRQIWVIFFLLCAASLLVVTSAISNLAYRFNKGYTDTYFIQHFGRLAFGAFLAYVVHLINFQKLKPWLRGLLWLMPVLLIYTFFKGRNVGEASRWISILGVISVQSSDIVKVVLISNLALMLANKQHIQRDEYKMSALNNIIIWCALLCGMLVLSSFSTAVTLLITCFMVMMAGRVPFRHLFRMVSFTVFSAIIFIFISIAAERNGISFARSNTIVDRTEAFFKVELDNKDGIGGEVGKDNNQRTYGLVAVASGGLTGVGPGNSFQKYKLPLVYSDFIYTIIVEEYGLLGGIVIMILYLWLLYRGVYNIDSTQRPFGGLLCVGLTLSIVFQAFIHIAVCVGIIPVTGQTLPLISLGGSSIVMTSVAIGMVLSVTHYDKETPTFVERRKGE